MHEYNVSAVTIGLVECGYHAGTLAAFVHFSACNLWSGLNADRKREALEKGTRCPLWCNADCTPDVAPIAVDYLQSRIFGVSDLRVALVVLTGGEPALQVDTSLVEVVRAAQPNALVAMETNGTVSVREGLVDWLILSPKVPPEMLAQTWCDELHIMYPAYDPLAYGPMITAKHRFVRAYGSPIPDGRTLDRNRSQAVHFVYGHPEWRLVTS